MWEGRAKGQGSLRVRINPGCRQTAAGQVQANSPDTPLGALTAADKKPAHQAEMLGQTGGLLPFLPRRPLASQF